MPASWVRRSYEGVGVTQYPPGPHLDAVQEQVQGAALLCIDVSGSMTGDPLDAARRGARQFLAEAREAHYRVGLVLWHHGIDTTVPLGSRPAQGAAALAKAKARGGTNLVDTLRYAISVLVPLAGDRVVCVFGDGDVGDAKTCAELVREARSHGIRFVVRGLGEDSSALLAEVLTPGEAQADQTVRDAGQIERGIASMVRHLRR